MLILALLLAGTAYPDGPPWGHAGAPDSDTCHACHWDGEVQTASPRLSLDGLPDHFVPGERYELTVRLDDARETNGFQLVASRGEFGSISSATQVGDNAIRSVRPAGIWQVVWVADASDDAVHFWLVVNDANGDGSEFGDQILLREYTTSPAEARPSNRFAILE